LEGEKKFLSELCELRNFRDGYNLKYSCPVQHETVLEPSPAFVMLTGVRKRLLPLTKREGCDSVISSDFKSKISITNENNLPRKELSAQVPQYLSNFSETVFSRFTSHFSRKRTAFTLAEVLITLGIIGIVAVITLPTIINNYRVKVLENQFKKADSIIQQAVQKTANEYGYSSITELNMAGNCNGHVAYPNYLQLEAQMPDINEIWERQFLNVKRMNDSEMYWRNIPCNSFWGTRISLSYYCLGPHASYMILPDGVTVSPLFAVDGACHQVLMMAVFDINGPYKGPNRIGYDIFRYQTVDYNKMCNPNIVNSENFKGCYYWAHRNVSPQDSSKPYWDVLYKPLNYWNPSK
ncbi:MAG: hypothetical protein DK841_09385, partial [Candidatus Melainabacteria bacterium]